MLMTPAKIGRLMRTVLHLKPGQIINRVSRRVLRARDVRGPTPAIREAEQVFTPCPGRPASMIGPLSFLFLGEKGALGEPADWNSPGKAKLWLYNLHYFDDLLADGAPSRADWHRSLISNWIAANPPLAGNGWEPYVLSRRSVNWIGWHLAGNLLGPDALASLAMQARALSGLLEYHLLGNHLFANAKALVFLGAFFEGAEADRWLQTGVSILERELKEQILGDGGHFELSPMYHALTLEDLIDLVQLARIYPERLSGAATRQRWSERARAMLDWLAVMSHPDGEISLFNDAALGQTRTHAELSSYYAAASVNAAPPAEAAQRSRHLKASGHARLQRGSWVVLMDMAEVGPSYLPGHAHADTLSLEISLAGQRLITNGGTSVYAMGPHRDIERGTASHATVCIDGENSSETWASFRVGRRARVLGAQVSLGADRDTAEASHDGYRHLKGSPLLHREVSVGAETVLICDRCEARSPHDVTGRLPLHPSVRSVTLGGNGWDIVTRDGRTVRVVLSGPVEPGVEDGFFAGSFGVRTPRPVLTWTARGVRSLTVEVEFSL
ncbi:MAG: heparinase II/III family protein [Alphaproteobacteria bacterium]|nr:heparinase II/III family protein [Alphaproteobacteria bacterium]